LFVFYNYVIVANYPLTFSRLIFSLHKHREQNSNEQDQLAFLNNWLNAHFLDAQYALKKPILVAEFGKSFKDSGYSTNQRDQLFSTVYYKIYASAKRGGPASGAMFWQLLTGGMESFDDGYGIMLGQSSSTANVIAQQSHKLYLIRKIYARIANERRWKRARGNRRSSRFGGNRGGQIGN
jgi:mannan endo-1,4-beta-mannosidase